MAPTEEFISLERVGYWFFRLNGCLNLENFLIHHESKGKEGTEVDLLGVRFPFRKELLLSSGEHMEDLKYFANSHFTDLIFAEFKRGLCKINGPWTDSSKGNMQRVLLALGLFPLEEIESVARCLYADQFYEYEGVRVSFFTIGDETNPDLSKRVIQLEWRMVFNFIYQRFKKYRSEKSQHRQWDAMGQLLFETVGRSEDKDEFAAKLMQEIAA